MKQTLMAATFQSLRKPWPWIVSSVSDLIFLFFFGWEFGIMLMAKSDEYLQALQERLTLAAASVSGETIQPTFFSDMLSFDPIISETAASFGLFIVFSALTFYCLYVSSQAVSWYFSHRMAGNKPDFLRFVLRFMAQSGWIIGGFLLLQGASLLYSINAVMLTAERGGGIPQPWWMVAGTILIAIIAILAYSKQGFRKGFSFVYQNFPSAAMGSVSVLGVFFILSQVNGWITGYPQLFFQAIIVVPAFTLARVFFINLGKADE